MNDRKRSCKSWKLPARTLQQAKQVWTKVLRWLDDFLSISPDRRQGEMIPIRSDNRRANRKVVFFDDQDTVKRALMLLVLLFLLALGINRVAFG